MKLFSIASTWDVRGVSFTARGNVIAEDEIDARRVALEAMGCAAFSDCDVREIFSGADLKVASKKDLPPSGGYEPLRRWELFARVLVDSRSEAAAWKSAARAMAAGSADAGRGVSLLKRHIGAVEDIDNLSRGEASAQMTRIRLFEGGSARGGR